jgi:glycosyltransferase involved in cell wall biosynthesis
LMGALAARIPAVVATSQLFIQLPYGRLTRLQLRLLAAGIGRYIAVSQAVREQWQTVFGIPAHKLCVIHNAIPAHLFVGSPPIEPLPVRSPSGHPPTILTVARLDAQKGLTYLLDAAALVPQARFWLAGEGPERTHLEEQARRLQLGERVTFLGHRQDIATLLATCDLFVLPSLFEGLPLALLEAMAAGKPVIASAIAGIKEVVVDQKSGWLIPPADAPALAQAINTLLVNPGLADRYAQAGQRHVQAEFALESMVKRVTQIYTELLGGEQ